MKKRILGAVAGAALLGGVVMSAAPAEAASNVDLDCQIYQGVKGNLQVTGWTNQQSTINVYLWVQDTAADGHHVSIRLVTKDSSGHTHLWPRHDNYGGNGVAMDWETTARDSSGIYDVGITVEVMEGDSEVDWNTCMVSDT